MVSRVPVADIAAVARKLTRAQQEAMLADKVYAIGWPPTIRCLRRLCLVQSPDIPSGLSRFTPLGEQVRAHLTKEKNDGK